MHKVVGQVQAIDRMLDDENISCENILIQINATRAALLRCGKLILDEHIENCIKDGIKNGDAEKTLESFSTAIERFEDMA